MTLKLGCVVWVKLPESGRGSSEGHEQMGRRPAIVVESDEFIPQFPTILIVPTATTQAAAKRFPTTFKISPSPQNGLRHVSFALPFQLRAVDKRRIDRVIGKLSKRDIDTLFSALRKLLSCLSG